MYLSSSWVQPIVKYFLWLLKRILLTEDKDFGELVYRLRRPAYGVILLRFEISERSLKWLRLNELLKKFGARLPSNFVTVDAEKFRFRPLQVKELN
jgi:predicted nuclease of predicted toxin-antitoxin system